MSCQQCGQVIPENTRFCPYCGAIQAVVPSAPPPMPPIPPAPMPSYQPQPAYQPQSGSPGISVKAIAIITLILFVLFVGGAVAVWLIFFPPGVYVRDRFSSAHPEIASQIQSLGAKVGDGVVSIAPANEKFDALIYQTPASNQATLEATILWKEGDDSSIFGVICCAEDENNFLVFMIKTKGIYSLYQYLDGEWYELATDLHVPKNLKIEKNVPYKMTAVMEGETMSFYLNDVLLAKLFDSYGEHKGRFGLYAQGGKSGPTTVAFDSFEAKKNSLFQKE